ncbi:MAG: TetR/AcrR family transcriptional regulator [Gammaproteobacteria bacterium]|nr:TetR/AcrR family transcriptional regulator [Gammaproteobacteria bacterium]MCP5443334.1 TetR/AcrR family transcriptional regulator [Chromatiaceae bacterium]
MYSTAQPNSESISSGEAAILEAAEVLFAEKGFDAVSIRAIAGKADVCKANVFHHFGSKEGLYLAVLRSAVTESKQILEELEGASGNQQERLRQFAGRHLRSILGHPHVSRLILREALEGGSERGKELAEKIVGDNFSQLVDLCRAGQKSGELRPELDPALVATLMVAANVFFFEAASVMRHIPEIKFYDDPQAYSAGVMDILLNGMANKKGER